MVVEEEEGEEEKEAPRRIERLTCAALPSIFFTQQTTANRFRFLPNRQSRGRPHAAPASSLLLRRAFDGSARAAHAALVMSALLPLPLTHLLLAAFVVLMAAAGLTPSPPPPRTRSYSPSPPNAAPLIASAAFRHRQLLRLRLHPAFNITASSRVLLVLAHPDDEAMFFTPAITNIMGAGASVHLLCLSTGNYDGLGAHRAREVAAAARVLGISSCSVTDDAELQDGPLNAWPAQAIGRRISEALQRTPATHILTFDSGGVSAHPNHIDTHRGCLHFVQSHPSVQLLTLHTSHLLLKYLGALAVILPTATPSRALHVARVCNSAPQLVVQAMRAHGSQLTWFRWLFIVFSHYTYFNDMVLHQQE